MQIDRHSRTPLYEQVIAEVERGILTGEYGPDAPIPSVRSLSMELSINPNTLQKAYLELERRGLCYSVPGNGRFVSRDAEEKLRTMKRELLERVSSLSRELRISGVAEEEVVSAVRTAYSDADGSAKEEPFSNKEGENK